MLTRIDLRGVEPDAAARRLPRAAVDIEGVRETVRGIVRDVRTRGDAALREIEARVGTPAREGLRVPAERLRAALDEAEPGLADALRAAAARILAYHERQVAAERSRSWRLGEPGMEVGEETRPLRRVGCYVPGGRAAYPSTVLMTVLAARAAGVEETAVCVPAGPDGLVHPATLAACALAGAGEVYACGGAQAVAALAYGTETIPRVDRIVGPGSLWVSVAKHEVSLDVGVDGFAGPTEVAIVADETAPAAFVAADLVAQAEHDPLATAILLTPSEDLIARVEEALEGEVASAARRGEVEKALRGQGCAAVTDDLPAAVAAADAFAPEHLELICEDTERWLPRIRHAGAVFVGAYSPVALGDYVAGTNHVLPTAGTARFASPLRASDFLRSMAVVRFDRRGLDPVASALERLAAAEGLDAHARALAVRLEERP